MRFGIFVADFDEDLLSLKVESLIFPFDTPSGILRRAEQNFDVLLEFKPFQGGFIEDVFGRKGKIEPLGCPSDENLRERNLSKLKEIPYKVIADFVRFPSPASREWFFSCFCDNCRRKARELGYSFDEMRKNVMKYMKEGDLKLLDSWLEFKMDVIRDYLNCSGLRRVFFFTPSLSFLVGQSYEMKLDVIYPMIYPRCDGPACIDEELSHMDKSIKSGVLRRMGSFEGLMKREFEKAKKSPSRVEPIIMVEDLPEGLKMGADKLHLFAYSKEKKKIFREFLQGVHQQQCKR